MRNIIHLVEHATTRINCLIDSCYLAEGRYPTHKKINVSDHTLEVIKNYLPLQFFQVESLNSLSSFDAKLRLEHEKHLTASLHQDNYSELL